MQTASTVNKGGNGSAAKAATKPTRMTLDAITSGKKKRPARVLLYGTEGVGKSTWASNAPAPVFLGTEDGTAQLDVSRFPEPTTWDEALAAVDTLTTAEHAYRSLVVDTLDWLEPLCWAAVVEAAGVHNIEDLGFGKGYVAALDKWRAMLARLDALRDRRGMHVILLAHSWIKTFRNPEGDDFDRYELKLHAKTSGLVKEWSDAVLFACYETLTATDKSKRTRGVSTGARIVHTERRAAFDAKNRYGLPAELPLDWSAFAEAMATGTPADAAAILSAITAALADAPADLGEKVRAAADAANGDAGALARVLDKLNARLAISNQK